VKEVVMPHVRAALRESRLAPLVAGAVVLLGVQVLWSTVAHMRGAARELRGLRTRLLANGAHVDRDDPATVLQWSRRTPNVYAG